MIVTRTPFRVTLGGGGTDLPSYYQKYGGFVFAMGIDKYMYVMTNPPSADNLIRLHYSQSETVNHVSKLRHELAREALRLHNITERMEISSMADLPAGTGLGSSSCYLVGLLMALHQYRRNYIDLQALAEEACHIEIEILRKGIGKQDQYMAAFGGLTVLDLDKDGKVKVRTIEMGSGSIADFVSRTHLYYTGLQRNALEILDHQNATMKSASNQNHTVVAESLHQIKEIGYQVLEAIENENFDIWGELLHAHWQHKKKLSNKISKTQIDEIYETVRREHHVLGGKIIGAGGGGFLMLYCAKNPKELEKFMAQQGMPRLHYTIEREGSKIVASLASSQFMVFHPNGKSENL